MVTGGREAHGPAGRLHRLLPRSQGRFEARVSDGDTDATRRRRIRSPSTIAASARGGSCCRTGGARTITCRWLRARRRRTPAVERLTTLADLADVGSRAAPPSTSSRGSSTGCAARRPSNGAHPRRGRGRRGGPLRADPGRPRTSPAPCLAALLALPPRSTMFLDIEADPVRARRRSRVPVRILEPAVEPDPEGSTRRAPSRLPRTLGPRPGQVRRRSGCSRRSSTWSSSGGSATRTPRLPLRRLRIGRARAAHAAARDPRGARSTAAPRRRPRRPVRPRGPAGHPRERRELLDQEARDVLHAPARGRDQDPSRVRRSWSTWLELGPDAPVDDPADPSGDRGLQPRRLCLATSSSATGSRHGEIEALATHPEWYPDGVVPRPAWEEGAPNEKIAIAQAETRQAPRTPLRAGVPEDRLLSHSRRNRALASRALVDWHRREDEAAWWRSLPARRSIAGRPHRGRRRPRGPPASRRSRPDRPLKPSPVSGSTRRRTPRFSRGRRTSR